jgi:hypothetical protein
MAAGESWLESTTTAASQPPGRPPLSWNFHLDKSADRYYHGGDELYWLKEVPGVWHEQCLRIETSDNSNSRLRSNRPCLQSRDLGVACYAQVPDKSGGLNGSTQHYLDVYFEESKKLKPFASVDSNGNTTLSRVEYSRTVRFSRGSIVVSPD